MQKILNLIAQTKEKFIILNNQGNPEAVILPFAEYEKLQQKAKSCDTNFSPLTNSPDLDNINLNVATEFLPEEKLSKFDNDSINFDDDIENDEDDSFYLEKIDE